MIRVDSARDQVNVAKIFECGQGHIFDYWDDLSISERARLLAQLSEFDAHELQRLVDTLVTNRDGESEASLGERQPAPVIAIPSSPLEEQERARAIAAGNKALAAGEVGVFTVAGGQGTRLRFAGPKGMFPVGPVSDRSLFEVFAQKILALGRRTRRAIPWFIMTSADNHRTTREFFQKHSCFGLHPGDVSFHQQGLIPIVDMRGKILLKSRGEIVMGPDGHGATARLIARMREQLAQRGTRYIFYHQVDNPLIKMCDAAFLGYHIVRNSQFSSKAVLKNRADEKVGVFCMTDGKMRVVEYSELSKEESARRQPDGELVFRAGNIACHVMSTEFLCPAGKRDGIPLPYHVARKATAFFRDDESVESVEPNSIKFESFLFDALPLARNPLVVATPREEEFSPIKNLDGVDSPETCRRALSEEYARWLEEAGVEVPRDADGSLRGKVEISPLFADSAHELRERLAGTELRFADPMVLR